MPNLIRWHDELRILPLLLIASIVMLLAIAAAVLWTRGSLMGDDARFASLRGLSAGDAYDKVEPGRTSQSQLAKLGFDSNRLRARVLSGSWGCRNISHAQGRRPSSTGWSPAVRSCFDAPDRRCQALGLSAGRAQGERLHDRRCQIAHPAAYHLPAEERPGGVQDGARRLAEQESAVKRARRFLRHPAVGCRTTRAQARAVRDF